ncbi:MAG: ATP-binding protein [Pseudomonadota bacterium]
MAFPGQQITRLGGHEIWQMDPNLDLPREALVVTLPVPRVSMTARGFLDIAPARSIARLAAMLAAALIALVGLTLFTLMIWRRRLTDRLAFEAAVNTRLEAEVESRTSELRATQHQLVQASKMTALGEMSAGITHELNQPLAAIMNFASNGVRLIDLERRSEARGNLEHIGQQVQRIDRIIRNLRGFARNEEEKLEPIDLIQCTIEALGLADTAINDAGTTILSDFPAKPVFVMGGQVRLQQVIVNLLTNAIDAMQSDADGQINLAIKTGEGKATLSVRDTGHGIADPTRIFEPFYTTKELGASKGLGLGLSISYGIVGSFGGDLTAHNHAEGGAVFVVTLPLVTEDAL